MFNYRGLNINLNVIIILLSYLTLISCSQERPITVTGIETTKISSKAKASITSAAIVNNQLVLTGSNLDGVTQIKVTGASGFNEDFAIETQTDSNLVANGLKNISFALDSLFSVIISDAHGSATFSVSFDLNINSVETNHLQDGAVTAAKLHDMGASDGDALIFNTATGLWEAKALSGLSYLGSWDANTNNPALADGGANTSPVAGEYYVVSNSGSTLIDGINVWNAGDWIIFNGTSWDYISNSSTVLSFNGRQGSITPQANDYTWNQIDKTTSDINDIANVDTTGASNGKILKFNGTTWVVSDDDTSIGAGEVTSTEILDGSITDADISGSISQTKISNLSTDLAQKLSIDGSIAMTADLDMGANNITNVGNVDGVDISALKTQSDNNLTSINTNISNISTNTTDIANRIPTSYLDTDTSLTADSDTKIPTQKAIKNYVDTQVALSGMGDFLRDGTLAMTGNLNVGTNDITNVGTVDGVDVSTLKTQSDTNTTNIATNATDIANRIPTSYLDIDVNLTADSDTKIPSQKAIKNYVDAKVAASGSGDFLRDGSLAMTGNLNLGTGNIINVGTVDGVDIAALKTQSDSNVTTIASNTTNIATNATDIGNRIPTSYLDTDINLAANSDTKIATQKAVKNYVDTKVAASGSGDFLRDGTLAMTGDINVGSNNITNVGNVDGVDVSALKTQSDSNASSISTNTTDIATNATDIGNRIPTSYLDTDVNLAADSDTKIPSQKAIKAYVDASVVSAGGGDFMADGSVAMTGKLQSNITMNHSAGTQYAQEMSITDNKTGGASSGLFIDNTLGTSYADRAAVETKTLSTDSNGLVHAKLSTDEYAVYANNNRGTALYVESSHAWQGKGIELITAGTGIEMDIGAGTSSARHGLIIKTNDTPAHADNSLIYLNQDTNSYANTVIKAEMAEGSGSFTGKFIDFINNTVSQFSVSSSGDVTSRSIASENVEVSGELTTNANDAVASTAINFDTGNIQYTSADCGAFSLEGLDDGTSYTLIVQGTTSATCSFSAINSNAGDTVKLPPGHGATVAGTHTIYTFIKAGSYIYAAYITGY